MDFFHDHSTLIKGLKGCGLEKTTTLSSISIMNSPPQSSPPHSKEVETISHKSKDPLVVDEALVPLSKKQKVGESSPHSQQVYSLEHLKDNKVYIFQNGFKSIGCDCCSNSATHKSSLVGTYNSKRKALVAMRCSIKEKL